MQIILALQGGPIIGRRMMEDEYDGPTCPCCSGPGIVLGSLGYIEWFRCRDCGMEYRDEP